MEGDGYKYRILFHFLPVSIHAPRVEGDAKESHEPRIIEVSIHAPRVEGDTADGQTANRQGVSIHAPRVEGDGRR